MHVSTKSPEISSRYLPPSHPSLLPLRRSTQDREWSLYHTALTSDWIVQARPTWDQATAGTRAHHAAQPAEAFSRVEAGGAGAQRLARPTYPPLNQRHSPLRRRLSARRLGRFLKTLERWNCRCRVPCAQIVFVVPNAHWNVDSTRV